MRRRHELSDEQWEAVSRFLPQPHGRQSERGDRNFVNAVVWIAKTGAPWRDLPGRFGPWKTVYNRFRRWAKKDAWHDIFRSLCVNDDDVGAILDGSIVRAHQDASGGCNASRKNKPVSASPRTRSFNELLTLRDDEVVARTSTGQELVDAYRPNKQWKKERRKARREFLTEKLKSLQLARKVEDALRAAIKKPVVSLEEPAVLRKFVKSIIPDYLRDLSQYAATPPQADHSCDEDAVVPPWAADTFIEV